MKNMPAGAPARNGMNVYEIYAGDLSRRVGLLTGNRPPLTRPGARPAASPIASSFFEDE